MSRWTATVMYRSEAGTVDVQHDIEELMDLQELVEAGPDWGAIEGIHIQLTNPIIPEMTLEDAQRMAQMNGDEWDAYVEHRKGQA